jgi:GNAT superfamily N-acetyltransferase
MPRADVPAWRLRAGCDADLEWAFELHEAALRAYVEQTWGWDETVQRRLFAEAFRRQARQVIQVADQDVGVLVVEDRADELFLALLELWPAWQDKGLGTDIVRWLLQRVAHAGKTLRVHVLRANPRAAALYEREGLRVVGSDQLRLVMRSDHRGQRRTRA